MTLARTDAALRMEGVRKIYQVGDEVVVALDGVDLTVGSDEIVALVGPSGSGKTTLCSIAGALLAPTDGAVVVAGEDISGYSAKRLTEFRRESVGFVFQTVNLIPFLTARENLLVVDEIGPRRGGKAKARADQLLRGTRPDRPRRQPAGAVVRRAAAAGRHRAGADERTRPGAV